MNTKTLMLNTAGALALTLTAPALAQSTETLSLNYERITSAQAGIEPDEIDYAGDAPCATRAAYMRLDHPDGESSPASQPCDPQAGVGLLLPAVQRHHPEDQQTRGCGSGEQHCDWMPIESVSGQNASGASPHVRVFDGAALTGEAEITLKHGTASTRRGD